MVSFIGWVFGRIWINIINILRGGITIELTERQISLIKLLMPA